MQPALSPGGSDSGVSVESGGQSPQFSTDTMTQYSCDGMSGSPTSDFYHLSPGHSSNHSEMSPVAAPEQLNQIEAFDLENLDFSDIEMNFDTFDPNALDCENMEKQAAFEDNVSIDLGWLNSHCFMVEILFTQIITITTV